MIRESSVCFIISVQINCIFHLSTSKVISFSIKSLSAQYCHKHSIFGCIHQWVAILSPGKWVLVPCLTDKLCPQTPSTGFSDNWVSQCWECLEPFTWISKNSWCLTSHLKLGLSLRWSSKEEKKKNGTNARVPGQRKHYLIKRCYSKTWEVWWYASDNIQ